METHARPSPAERAYAVCIAVLVPVFLVAVWVGGSIKDGVVDTASMKSEAMYFLAYLGVIFIAFWIGNAVPQRFTFPIGGTTSPAPLSGWGFRSLRLRAYITGFSQALSGSPNISVPTCYLHS
jgi:hypothetical protein